VVSREIRRNGGKCGYQPVWQLMRNTPETPDLVKGPQNSMPHRVLKARVLADLKRSRTPRQIVAGTPGGGL